MGKATANKQLKFTSLLEAAFELFSEKGVGEISSSCMSREKYSR